MTDIGPIRRALIAVGDQRDAALRRCAEAELVLGDLAAWWDGRRGIGELKLIARRARQHLVNSGAVVSMTPAAANRPDSDWRST